jgi:(1->4)-alpha-D-glucan 1-alpha-D-glucosylmutase
MATPGDLAGPLHPRDARQRLPEATYRLQFHTGFTFRQAAAIAGYLHDLGITHCYASPYLKARPGSTHGYDIIDHHHLNPEIGSGEDYAAFVEALHQNDLGQILDIVPNHMGVAGNENPWWNDVLENGPASPFASFFDISWQAPTRPELQNRVLLPVLGDSYGKVLESGQLRVLFEAGAFAVSYYDRRFPVDPRSYGIILEQRVDDLEKVLAADSPALIEYKSILTAVRHLPARTETEPDKLAEGQREKEVIKRRLTTLTASSAAVRDFLQQTVTLLNGTPGKTHSFDLLDRLLDEQPYRLAYWRVASDEINYRRFFDVNDLAALSMEREDVFAAAHELVFRLIAEDKVDGLRIDHPDGLFDPKQYLERLQCNYREICPEKKGPLYVVVEKILETGESLCTDWPTNGTTGYEFLNAVNGLFVEGHAAAAFTRLYRDLVGMDIPFAEQVYHDKYLILQVALASELHMLAHQLDRLAQKHRASRDFTLNSLRHALRAVISCFPVYRSYIGDEGVRPEDRRYIDSALRLARIRNPALSPALFRFIRSMLLLDYPASASEADRAEQRRFAGKFQQVTSPVMAKGLEDTAFYVYDRLLSLNEVGGDPARFGVWPEALHRFNRERQARSPFGLSPLSTHDTKRSEDVRARLNVLSELPGEWQAAVERWRNLNEPLRQQAEDTPVPDANEEYHIYQTLVGAWPMESCPAEEWASFVQRVQQYMLKALHEAKVHSSWMNPDTEYDEAVSRFVGLILDPALNGAFLDDFRSFHERVSELGMLNSLAQTLLRLASPGVPDTYQGTELWDLSLVDPDNRRPVDYERRRELLAELKSSVSVPAADRLALVRQLLASRTDGRVKLYLSWQALNCRRDRPGLFSSGEYLPAEVVGSQAEHAFGFVRRQGERWAAVVVPRLLAGMAADSDDLPLGASVWQNTQLLLPGIAPKARVRNVLTSEELVIDDREGKPALALADVLAHFPVALLVSGGK